ncbi:MAG: ATP-dependent helicase [Candidatus Kapabacteria bacterium]|nr:ATP-dependent helicase [Ignavibacteriota bacterium]MCW5885256.1 ATP-dependent helicase [Candidatus Kapabacteria bacterium]
MKKLILRKEKIVKGKSPTYKINYEQELNKSQYDAVMHNTGAALVIAGAGTGKTRTLVYRVARLIEDGNIPESILLLTFTRKSASEMLRRASLLLDGRCEDVAGGTFHSFAVIVLRYYAKLIGYEGSFTILDQSDSEDAINMIRSDYVITGAKRRFPTKQTLQRIYSMSINTRTSVQDIIEDTYPYFLEEADKIQSLLTKYHEYKKYHNIMDYDDLLLNLLTLLRDHKNVLHTLNNRYKFVMVDEYQDTNKLQHEIVLHLSGPDSNVMAVGDDAQSIYSFRGASYQNIMFFPESFSNCQIYKIEENYRSTSQILDLSNHIIKEALFKYDKNLYSKNLHGEMPALICARTEREQSMFLVQQILELRESDIPLNEIAVLFRSGFHSFDFEIELEKANIPYVKYGGLKFIETAHVKDMVAYLRILYNPRDAISWQRVLMLIEGIGPKKSQSLIEMIGSGKINIAKIDESVIKSQPEKVVELFTMLANLIKEKYSISDKCAIIAEYYRPLLKIKHDDWKKRWEDIETFITIAERYKGLQNFLNDLAIDPPSESVKDLSPENTDSEMLCLSTIHSAKGLEWQAVFVIWALEGRFPSAKAVQNIDSVEEERRLFYVAVTRAKKFLYITYPTNIYDRESGFVLSEPSRFIRELPEGIIERLVISEEESENEIDFSLN